MFDYNPVNSTLNVKMSPNDFKSNPSDPECFLIGEKSKDKIELIKSSI